MIDINILYIYAQSTLGRNKGRQAINKEVKVRFLLCALVISRRDKGRGGMRGAGRRESYKTFFFFFL